MIFLLFDHFMKMFNHSQKEKMKYKKKILKDYTKKEKEFSLSNV